VSVKTAQVKMWGAFVGALAQDSETGLATFEYAPEWLDKKIEIAPLRMPLAKRKYSFPGLNPATYKGLPAVFAESLPDDFGNAVINAWLARQGRSPNSFLSLERLLYNGSRGMGALEYAPAMRERGRNPAGPLDLESLVEMAQRVLDQRANLDVDVSAADDESMDTIFQLGTSAGGARAKAVIAINQNRTSIRSGQLTAPPGYEHYLLKFDGVSEKASTSETFGDPRGYGLMEYAYYRMATDAGIRMSPSELLHEHNRSHFMTKRFDRIGNDKVHMLSLCGMDHSDFKKPGTYSYEELFAVARKLRLSRAEAIEIFRRMVFNVVARNQDDHAKNVAFLLAREDLKWQLAPAYDVAYSYRKDSPWVGSHQLTLNGKRDDFTRADLHAVASSCIGHFSIKDADAIIDKVIEVVARWDQYAKDVGVFPELKREIKNNLRLGIR
jgi:serine/threonine-protein kinase HipA